MNLCKTLFQNDSYQAALAALIDLPGLLIGLFCLIVLIKYKRSAGRKKSESRKLITYLIYRTTCLTLLFASDLLHVPYLLSSDWQQSLSGSVWQLAGVQFGHAVILFLVSILDLTLTIDLFLTEVRIRLRCLNFNSLFVLFAASIISMIMHFHIFLDYSITESPFSSIYAVSISEKYDESREAGFANARTIIKDCVILVAIAIMDLVILLSKSLNTDQDAVKRRRVVLLTGLFYLVSHIGWTVHGIRSMSSFNTSTTRHWWWCWSKWTEKTLYLTHICLFIIYSVFFRRYESNKLRI